MDSDWEHSWPHRQDVDDVERPYLRHALMYSEPVVPALHDLLWARVPERDDVQGGELLATRALPPYSG